MKNILTIIMFLTVVESCVPRSKNELSQNRSHNGTIYSSNNNMRTLRLQMEK